MRWGETAVDARRWLEARPKVELALFAAVLLFGIVARVGTLLYRPSLWGDEAALALNVEPRSFFELGKPFVYRQVAPWGVLAGMKLSTLFVGATDFGFRLFPFLGGIVATAAVYPVARRIAGPIAALSAMFFIGCSSTLTYYGAEVKPYAIDAAVAGVLMFLTVRVLDRPHERARWWVMGVAGVVAGWISLPSLFVLGACGATLLMDAWSSARDLRRVGLIAALGLVWVVAFAVHYQMVIVQSAVASSKGASAYWDPGFAPFPPKELSDLRWYVGRYFYSYSNPGGLAHKYLAGAIGGAGIITALVRKQHKLLMLVAGPALLALMASMLRKYPAIERLLMFAVPSMGILMGVGIAVIAERRSWLVGAVAVACIATVTVPVLPETFEFTYAPAAEPDFEDLARELSARKEPGDLVYLSGAGLGTVYDHYGPKYELPMDYLGRYEPRRLDDNGRFVNLPRLVDDVFGRDRVWFVLSTYQGTKDPKVVGRSEESLFAFMTRYLDRHGARRLETVDGYGMVLILYDLSEVVRPEGDDKYENDARVAQSS
ncbi:MAG: glycosyltransferase family 39 protein [Deltaproteobacteria bacterium]